MNKNSEASRDTNTEAGVSRSRRRLVKNAVVAAPVILTLPSGAAAATASAFQCIARDHATADADPPPELVSTPDGWVRTQTHCTTTTDANGNPILQETGDPNDPLCYKLVRFDLEGNIVDAPAGGPVTPSCYASFG